MADTPATSAADTTAEILALAAAEAATPGADTGDAYECPFCVMMRKGGCEDPFKAFMACGEKADKGEIEMAECLKEFEALNTCMERNKDMFDGLLTEMKEEEDRVKEHETQQGGSSTTAAAAVVTTHSQEAQQQQEGSSEGVAGGNTAAAAAAAAAVAAVAASSSQVQQQVGGSSRGGTEGVPATM